MQEHLYHPPPAGMLPQELASPLMRALEKQPEWRFPTCAAFVEEISKAPGVAQLTPELWLQQLQTYTDRRAGSGPVIAPARKPKPKRPIAAWVFGISLLAAAIIAVFVIANSLSLNRLTASITATAMEARTDADQTQAAMLSATSLTTETPTATSTATATVTRTARPTSTTRPTNPPRPTATSSPKSAPAVPTSVPPAPVAQAPLALVDQAKAACGAQWETDEKCDNRALASKLFQQAAASGDMYSMRSLGILACGHKVLSENVCDDLAKAQTWFAKSADKGDIFSMTTLGKLFCGSAFKNSMARCLKPQTASEWLLRAASLNNVDAMYWLGWVYNDYGFKQDACNWWRKAVDLGDEDAKDPLQWYCL